MRKHINLNLSIVLCLIFTFLTNALGPVPLVEAGEFVLPLPGKMVLLSPAFNPAVLVGIKLDPQNPFSFHFYVDSGNDFRNHNNELKIESNKLIKYFFASLTIPEKDLWVNLSPYEKDRIVPPSFGQTEMGRDLLAEDYLLKQITASLIYPESQLGQKFWQKVYAQAQAKYGTTNVPINTFNKVWIVPDKAVVYENRGTAFVLENHLKVMLEQDYLSLSRHSGNSVILSEAKDLNKINSIRDSSALGPQNDERHGNVYPLALRNETASIGANIIREIVIPALTKEVNEGKNFAKLRQVFYSLILATWYKKKVKDSILNKVYADKNKIAGVGYLHSVILGPSPQSDTEKIYQRYLQAFKKGVYNYIKEEPDSITNQTIPRKYFSGGVNASRIGYDMAMVDPQKITPDQSKELNRRKLVDEFVLSKLVEYKEIPAASLKEGALGSRTIDPGLIKVREEKHDLGIMIMNTALALKLAQEPSTIKLLPDQLQSAIKIFDDLQSTKLENSDDIGSIKDYFLTIKAKLASFQKILSNILQTNPDINSQLHNLSVTSVVDRVNGLSKYLNGIIEGTFDFNKAVKVPGDLNAMVNNTINSFGKNEKIKIVFNQGKGLKAVPFEASKLEHVINNLLKNAQDAIAESQGQIIVQTKREGKDAVITVADNGPGIPPAIQSKIFQPFFTTKGNKGTGLGLDISRQIIEAHGGKISVNSALGKGATFTVRIPADSAMRSLDTVLNTRQFATLKDMQRFAGTGKVATSLEDGKSLAWLTLTDHIAVRFVALPSPWSMDFLKYDKIDQKNDNPVYLYTLPEDITVRQTLALIKSIRNLPLSDKEKIFPHIPGKFIRTAVYLAKKHQQQMTHEKAEIIRTYYALGLILGAETTNVVAPEIYAIAREQIDPAYEEEVKQWLGLDEEGMGDARQLMEKAAALAVQGTQIELESLTYWRGGRLFKNDLKVPRFRSLNVILRKVGLEKMVKSIGFLKTLLTKKIELAGQIKKINDAKQEFGARSHEAAEAEVNAIKSILDQIGNIPGWVKKNGIYRTIFESSPAFGRLTNELNCQGRNALTALYLQDLGIDKVWSVSADDHVFLLALLSDGRYFWVEPSGDSSKNRIASFPLGISAIPPNGLNFDLNGKFGFNIVSIAPWREGVESAFYYNLGWILLVTKDYEGSILAYQKALELTPNDPFANVHFGIALSDMGLKRKAITALQKAMELNPTDHDVYNNLGSVLQEMGRNEEAIANFHTAIRLKPTAEAFNNLGIVLWEVGEKKQAIESYRQALQLAPHTNMAAQIRKFLKENDRLSKDQPADRAMMDERAAQWSELKNEMLKVWEGLDIRNLENTGNQLPVLANQIARYFGISGVDPVQVINYGETFYFGIKYFLDHYDPLANNFDNLSHEEKLRYIKLISLLRESWSSHEFGHVITGIRAYYLEKTGENARNDPLVNECKKIYYEYRAFEYMWNFYPVYQSPELSAWVVSSKRDFLSRVGKLNEKIEETMQPGDHQSEGYQRVLSQLKVSSRDTTILASSIDLVLEKGQYKDLAFRSSLAEMLKALAEMYTNTVKIDEALTKLNSIGGLTNVKISYLELFYVLKNLVSNAVAEQRHGVPLEIKFDFRQDRDNVFIEVIDNGKGMKPEILEKVKAGTSVTTKGRLGTGQGLRTIRETLAKYGGSMDVESTPGAGSKFMIQIPKNEAMVTAPGGIDLDPARMRMQVKNGGEEFKFNFNGTEIDAAQVAGAAFTIRTMTPVTNLPLILGLTQEK